MLRKVFEKKNIILNVFSNYLTDFIVYEQPPTKRTIIVNGEKFFIEFPYVNFSFIYRWHPIPSNTI